MSARVTCPQCSRTVPPSALAAHLHLELNYFAWRCGICHFMFASAADARAHFTHDLSPHPGMVEQIVEAHDPDKLRLLTRLYKEAMGQPIDSDSADRQPPAKRTRLELVAPSTSQQTIESLTSLYDTAIDSSEDENPPQITYPSIVGVKAEVMENAEAVETKFTPPAPSDGKVACILCGSRQLKNVFHLHALRAHMDARPFLCDLCPYTAKQRHHVVGHQKTAHAGTPATVISLLESLKGEIRQTLEKCFGCRTDIPDPKVECRTCRIPVNLAHIKLHIMAKHLKRAMTACRLCDFCSHKSGQAEMRKHMKRNHDQALSPENYEDLTLSVGHIINSMKTELFGKSHL